MIDAPAKRIEWRLHQDQRHGIRKLTFGSTVTDIIFDGEQTVTVTSDAPYTLEINGIEYSVETGLNQLIIGEK